MSRDGQLLTRHGGYQNTRTWQLADLIYDVTVRFCEKSVDKRSRTHDQMVQAARSGCQNLLEGSVDSATSKKTEIKLTGIARGSLLELDRDYRKFLQHRDLPLWPPDHPALVRFKSLQCSTIKDFRQWVADEMARAQPTATPDFPATCAANGALSLLNVCTYLIRRQLEAQAAAFERDGGFTERMYQIRQKKRTRP